MRIIGRYPDERQVGAAVDSLRNAGFDRGDMIISNLADESEWHNTKDAAREIIFVKTERDGLGEIGNFAEGVKGLTGEEGIVVAVKTPKHESDRVRAILEQTGAVEIIQD